MDYSRPILANRLAADYALGTMRGAARRRMQSLLSAHPNLRHAVAHWEDELSELGTDQPGVMPSPMVWQSIERRLFGAAQQASRTHSASAPRPAWWRSLPFWQSWSALATVGALGLMLVLAQPSPAGAPIIVVLQANPQPGAAAGTSVDASFVASVSSDGQAIVLKPLNTLTALSPGRALELWAVPPQGAPRSLGLVRADAPTTILRTRLLLDTSAFAVSVEPSGGSPSGAPTGPIISLGKLQL